MLDYVQGGKSHNRSLLSDINWWYGVQYRGVVSQNVINQVQVAVLFDSLPFFRV